MPYVSDIRLAVSVHSEHLDPDEITELAGVSPTDSHRIGDPKGRVRPGTYSTNHWESAICVDGLAEGTDQIQWFSDGIARLLKPINVDFVLALLARDADAGAIIWVGLFDIQDQGAFNITPAASRLLGQYDLELVFDMYVDHDAD